MKKTWLIVGSVLLAGCTVGPRYQKPKVDVPTQFRAATVPETTPSIGDVKWAEVFGDPTVEQLVNSALQHNFDLAAAAERVEQARAQVGITRANQFPFLDLQAGFNGSRGSSVGSIRFVPKGTDLSSSYTQAGAALSWELDLFGRLRKLTEASRAQFLATEEARRGIVVALVGDVTSTYFDLLERDLELDISRKTRGIAEDSLRLVQLRHDRGAATGLEVRQAEQFLYTATAQIAAVERAIGQTEDALSLLLGQAPSDQPRGRPLADIPLPRALPAGLPSALLARRPDIRAAEQNLIAANAQIGAARALYFPQIGLTAFAGGQSRALTDIITAPARVYSVAPTALLPIFRAGQIRSQVRLTEAQERELLVRYQQSIFTALRDVSDALIGHSRTHEQRGQQELLVQALSETARLSTLRYEGGLDSYLQVLDAQRNLFAGQLQLAQLRLQELNSVVQLYRALGGGWE